MKKALSLILMLVMVFSALVPSMVLAADGINASSLVNLAAGKSYTTTAIYEETPGVQNWPDEGGVTLTDGVKAATNAGFSDPAWVGFNAKSPDYDSSANGLGATVIIDLGASCDISGIAFQAFGGDAGISVPYWVNIAVSNDGENFEYASYIEINPDAAPKGVSAYGANFDKNARYVRVCLYGYGWIFIDEIEVLGAAVEPENTQASVNVNDSACLTDGFKDLTDSWASGVPSGKVVNVMNGNCKEVGMDTAIVYALGETKSIDGVTVYFYVDAGSMIGYPEGKATVSVSLDGETYKVVGEYDLAEVDYSAPSTVANEFAFDAVEAAYVKVDVYAGSNEAVRGDAAWDGKVNWEFISLVEFAVSEVAVETPAIQPDELVALPEGALTLDYAGYKHAGAYSIVAGDGLTVSELTALGNNGAAKDMNYAYIVVVDADGIVTKVWYELSVSKADVVCPEGGYIISYNGNKAGYADLAAVKEGATITLYNINVDAFRGAEGNVELTGAGFTYENPADPVVIPEGAVEFLFSHVNLYSWGTFYDMVTYGEGRNCHNLGNGDYGCEWWLAIKVDNVDGVYTVTQIEGNGETKSMAASADGFVMYLFSGNENYPANFAAAQQIQVGYTVYSHTFDWTKDAASETALGNIIFVPAVKEEGENVALGKPVANADKRPSYNADITDGVALGNLTYNAEDWFGFYWNPGMDLEGNLNQSTNAINGIANPVVDLGGLYDLTTVRLNLFTGNNSGICAPETVTLKVSIDGVHYEEIEVRGFEWPEAGATNVEWVEFTLPEGTVAQYVCLEMVMRTTFVFINEIEVYGTESDATPAIKHNLVHVEAVEPGCHYEGTREHWYCDDCETVWLDEALTQVTNHKSVIIPATGEGLVVHMDAVEPGCHFTGNNEYWICYMCEQVWTDEALTQLTNIKNVVIPELGGDVVHVEAVANGCGYEGNIEHWYCEECGQVWADEARTQLTNHMSVRLPALEHDIVHVEAVAPGCHYEGNIEHWYCTNCETVWSDAELTLVTNHKSVIISELGGDVIHVEAVANGCGYEGNIEYWYCEECEQFWQDEARTQLTNSKNVILPALEHDIVHVEAVAPGCHYEGNSEHWYCTACETVWADEALTLVTNHKSVIISELGGDVVHMEAVAPGCHFTGNNEYWICYECEQVWADEARTQLTNIKNVVIPELGGDVIHVEAADSTCMSEGNIEYWHCEECEQVWVDEARTQLSNYLSVRLPVADHDIVHVEAVEPGCHYEGNNEYWYCTACETVWADEALTQITNRKNVIIPATGEGLLVHMDAVEPGCHYTGNNEYWICYMCEQVWADEALTQLTNIKNVVIPELGGDVIHVEAADSTCMSEGNIEYWYCEECDQVWVDEARTQLSNHMSVRLPVADHDIVHVEAVEPGCHYTGNVEYWYCTVCGIVWSDEALTMITNHKSVILPELGGDVVHMDAVAPGCHYTGNIEYWICYECEQVWADEARTQLTNTKNVILPELGGDVIHVEAVAPTKDAEGNIEYWYCEGCEQFWQDEARTQITNSKNVILPKLEGYDFGDVDGNGAVEVVDYMKLKRTILNTYELTEDELSRSDIDGNGKVDMVDYMMLKRYFLNTWTPEADND